MSIAAIKERLFLPGKEKPVSVVPRLILSVLLVSSLAQIYFATQRPQAVAKASLLPQPPALEVLQAISFGEEVSMSGLLMLWLQAFDNQPGISIPLKNLDYDRVIEWLDVILALDPRSQYPLLSAARVYSVIQDEEKKMKMLGFIREKYLDNPNGQWQAMAHATFIAKHRLHDLELALGYAKDLRINTTEKSVPSWVRQMELFVLEEMGEIEAAQILLGGLMESKVVKDEREFRFLQERLGLVESEIY